MLNLASYHHVAKYVFTLDIILSLYPMPCVSSYVTICVYVCFIIVMDIEYGV